MFPHSRAVSISTPVHSVTLGLPCRSLWPQLWAHLWCNPDWTTPTPFCMEYQYLTCTNYSLSIILLAVWFCFLFAVFQQVSDLVTSIVSWHLSCAVYWLEMAATTALAKWNLGERQLHDTYQEDRVDMNSKGDRYNKHAKKHSNYKQQTINDFCAVSSLIIHCML